MAKKLVAYFSATGTTARKAETLAEKIGADVHEIAPAERYTSADLDWTDRNARSTVECKDPASRPALKEKKTDLSAYDTVYVGFPIWWYTAPPIVRSFLEGNDFSGKKIILFATSGGSGIGKALKDLKASYPGLDFEKGVMVNGPVTGDIA